MTDRETLIAQGAKAIMRTRVTWGWTLGYKHRRVTAIDLLMSEAALDAFRAAQSPETGVSSGKSA